MFKGGLSNVLILENEGGEVYIVDGDESSKRLSEFTPQNDQPEIMLEDLNTSLIKNELTEDIIEEHLDESFIVSHFVDVIDDDIKPAIPKIKPHPDNPFCKYCDEKFNSRNDLWMHICDFLQCEPEKFICKVCLDHVLKKEFNNHVHEVLTCQQCEKQFNSEKSLNAHCQLMHGSGNKIDKNPMNHLLRRKGFNAKKDRNHPKHRSKRKEKLECDLCGKYLVSHQSLEYHMNIHRGHSSFICSSCGEKFYTPNGIRAHKCEKKRKRPEIDFRTYDTRKCRFCDLKFASFDENKAHACDYSDPENPKLVICRFCGKKLNKLAFNRHMECHTGKDWICGICTKKLATERALKNHMTTHTGNKPYSCKLCIETFINKAVLDRHMRFHGSTPKVFNCEFCFKQLSSDTSLRSHIQRVHSNSFQCELCKMRYSNKESLKQHLQVTHPPSECQVCGKSFALPRYLKMHVKLHYDTDDGTKMNCQICSKSQLMRNLKNHVYRYHFESFERWCKEFPNF